jgi:hypothetical protein
LNVSAHAAMRASVVDPWWAEFGIPMALQLILTYNKLRPCMVYRGLNFGHAIGLEANRNGISYEINIIWYFLSLEQKCNASSIRNFTRRYN